MIQRIHLKKSLSILVAILALYTITGFFLAPWIGEKILIKRWGNFMGRRVAIESVGINPYTLTVLAKGISVKEADGTDFISIGSLFANFSIISVFKLAPVVTQYEMDSPVVNLVLKKDNTLNISDMLQSSEAEPQDTPVDTPMGGSKLFGFKLTNAKILNGKIIVSDQIRGVVHQIENLKLDLPFLSTLEGDRKTTIAAGVDFSLNKDKIDIGLESLPFTPEQKSLITLKTGTMDLIKYLVYLPLPKALLMKGMETSLDLAVSYSKFQEKPTLILTGEGGFTNIDIHGDKKASVLSIPQINFTLAPSDLLNKQITLAHLKVLSPKVHLDRDAQGNLNFVKYFSPPEASNKTKDSSVPGQQEKALLTGDDNPDSGFVFQLAAGEIIDAGLFFTDATGKTPFQTTLSPISIQINDFSAAKKVQGKYGISLKSEIGESLVSHGKFATLPLAVEGEISLGKLNLQKYSPYYEDQINFDIREGLVDVDADFSLSKEQTQLTGLIKNRELTLSNFKVWDRINKEIPIFIPDLTISGSMIDMGQQRLDMGTIKTSQGKILLKRGIDTSINLVKNLMLAPQESSVQTSLPISSARSGEKTITPSDSTDSSVIPDTQTEPWDLRLESFLMDDYSLAFLDNSTKELVSIDLSDIRIHANDFQTLGKKKAGVEVDMVWNKTGKIKAKGELNPFLPQAGLDISLTELDIKSVQPYFTDQIKINITSGLAHAIGRLDFSMDKKKDPFISFKGKVGITDLASVDKETANDFFKCNIFYLSGMDVSIFPVKVLVDEISLTDFYSRVILSDKGEINLKQVFDHDSDPEKIPGSDRTDSGTQPLPEIYVKNMTLQGGDIHFTDYLTQPNFTAHMKEIAGGIKELSSLNPEPARLQLQGIHGQSSPLDIVGSIQPFALEKFFDVDISFKDIELTQFSSYAAKYIGYNIENGKLLLDLKYTINGNKLESQNRLFFDQLTLGERVDSKDATSLPVPLAISLLKNSEDQIDLDLPMGGNIDDPEFSFSGSVFEVFGNLITKVITAPFKFLGGMFGGGEELGFINFEHGSDTLKDEQIQKLDQLGDILVKKKELKLFIEGTYDRIRDGEILRKKQYEALLKSKKGEGLVEKGTLAPSQDVILLSEEREKAILTAYEQADFPKPRGEDGKEKIINTEEKEKLLQTNISITDVDLKELAMSRAEKIRSYLLSTGKLIPSRIFLQDPDSAESGPEQNRYSKVRFSIE